MSKKAQAVMTDIIIAFLIYMVILVSITLTYNKYVARLNEQLLIQEVRNKVYGVSDLLVRSPGYPESWNSSTVHTFGLAIADRNLSQEKIDNFFGMSDANYTNVEYRAV